MNKTISTIFIPLLTLTALFTMGFGSQLISDDTHFTSSLTYLSSPYNLHPVIENRVYRSSDMPEKVLEEKIRELGIRTVIDLRLGGDNPGKRGYSEKNLVEQLGAQYMWVPLAGTHTRQKKGMERLAMLSKDVEEPVLIHCDSGSHRSGIASAIWLINNSDITPEKAARQLSPTYGFYYWERRFKSYFIGSKTIDHIIWNYLAAYKESGIDFNTWVSQNTNPL